MSKVFVIAGNYDQYRRFRKNLVDTMMQEEIPVRYQDIVYVDPNNIRGYNDIWGYKVGTWHLRTDLQELETLLLVCRSSLNEFIEVEL